jgi:predicted O-linked N-acetylglucosamine transferase (SPINDLY family)
MHMIADLFAVSMKKASTQELGVNELLGAVEQLTKAGETALVLELYGTWVRHNQNHALLHAVCFNYGVVLSETGDLAGAKAALEQAIRRTGFLPPHINLGTVLERMGAGGAAVNLWIEAVNKLSAITGEGITYKTTALKQAGRVLEGVRIESKAEDALRLSLEADPHQRDVIQHWVALRQSQCKWPVVAPWGRVSRKVLMDGISPLSLAAYADDPLFQLAAAYHYNHEDICDTAAFYTAGGWPVPEAPRSRRLRIGYVSSDLREHAVGFLTTEIFELHDRQRTEVFAYYSGVKANDAIQARIKQTSEHWCDLTDLTDNQATQRIIADGIDILVDLNGYTKDARYKVFAKRPAPIIVNWLGYPGTLGSPYHNYIIADDFIIPDGDEIYYSEKVMRLPCYQPTDRKRAVSPNLPSRTSAGLPETGTVFCCFNGTQKFTRPVFDSWMTILRSTPGSVLWFLSPPEETIGRLKEMAGAAGVAADRLIFAGRLHNPDHMARFGLADVFLDTSPYGAHTTASDALWMGVPVLTVPGRGFASRVCGSLVQAAGIGELICKTMDEYVARAIEMGRDRVKIDYYKNKLRGNRDKCVLFDSKSLVLKLESLYEQMWMDYSQGKLPIPDLTNIDMYREIGRDLECGRELAETQDYNGLYLRKLAARWAFSPFARDSRLWRGDAVPSAPSSEASMGRQGDAAMRGLVRGSNGAEQRLQ